MVLLLCGARSYAQNEFYDIYVYDVLKGTYHQVTARKLFANRLVTRIGHIWCT